MVSFQCDGCADTVKKPHLDKHRQKCWASFTCLDCSTTFRRQEYNPRRSHVSCISEAQKYQGALYKAPKKGKQPDAPFRPDSTAPLTVPTTETPADSPAAIHPSRLNQLTSDAPPSLLPNGVPPRGGRGRFSGPPGRDTRGYGPLMSGENKLARQGGMRSWGSRPATEEAEEKAVMKGGGLEESTGTLNGTVEVAGGEKKKRKRKGDKGGTGVKANSKRSKGDENGEEPQSATTEPLLSTGTGDEPKRKKRKREGVDHPIENGDSPIHGRPATNGHAQPTSDKLLKRLRKSMSKLEKEPGHSSLAQWVEKVSKSKDQVSDTAEVLRGLRISFTDGRWVLHA